MSIVEYEAKFDELARFMLPWSLPTGPARRNSSTFRAQRSPNRLTVARNGYTDAV